MLNSCVYGYLWFLIRVVTIPHCYMLSLYPTSTCNIRCLPCKTAIAPHDNGQKLFSITFNLCLWTLRYFAGLFYFLQPYLQRIFDDNHILPLLRSEVNLFRVKSGFRLGCSSKIEVVVVGWKDFIQKYCWFSFSLDPLVRSDEWMKTSYWSEQASHWSIKCWFFSSFVTKRWVIDDDGAAWESRWVNGRLKVIEGVMQAHAHFLTREENIARIANAVQCHS